jgi:hypothetical protein
MKNSKALVFVTLLTSALLFAGCFDVGSNFLDVRDRVLDSTGSDFNYDIEFSADAPELSLAYLFVKSSHNKDKRFAGDIIKHLSRVEVGVYKNTDHSLRADYSMLRRIDDCLAGDGWQYIVKNIKPDEISAIYVNKDSDRMMKELWVVNINRKKLVLVKVRGDLDYVIQTALREKGLGLKFN